MDIPEIQSAFVAAGLGRVGKDIFFLARPSIRLVATAVDEATVAVGASKLGGVPDLPPGMSWPEWQAVPHSFIAQIRLDDVHPYDTQQVLPPQGFLWFFYDAQQQTYGENPEDRGSWQVFFTADGQTALQRRPAPVALPAESHFHACALRFASEMTLSQHPEAEIPAFDWTPDEQKRYEMLLSTFSSPADRAVPHHRLLGFPDAIQDDMRLQCQLVSHGVTESDDPRACDLAKGANTWRLLLQIDSDEQAGMRWADAGLLYYWITQADVQACQFDRTWLVLQSD